MILATLRPRAGETVSADVLIDTLWSERPPASASKALSGLRVGVAELIDPANRTGGVIQPVRGAIAWQSTGTGSISLVSRSSGNGSRPARGLSTRRCSGSARPSTISVAGRAAADLRYETAFSADASRL